MHEPPPGTSSDPSNDRRHRRSDDPLVALHYQLSSSRSRGELDAIVVADASGVVVAGAGSWPVCEELAAYAPLLADASWSESTEPVASRVDVLRRDAVVRAVSVGGQQILLCARTKREDAEATSRELDRAAAGISRILAAA